MPGFLRVYLVFALVLFASALLFGVIASWAFLYPETFNGYAPFYQLRPFHVSSALFWILSGATACILCFKNETFRVARNSYAIEKLFTWTWLATIFAIFLCYGLKKFGGRQYWEFPPVLSIPLLISWGLLMVAYFRPLLSSPWKKPMYVWMWTTGIFFFLLTFIEQNLWQVPWFRSSYLREVTVQWKANGSMVGAWNQMLYGSSLYLMVKISGDESQAQGKTVFFFYLLGLTNLMFNWGHHIYNVPGASWIRDTSYVISMTEWIFLIRMIRGFRKTLEETRKFKYLISYRFFIAAEFWVFMNLLLTLAMSVPAVNRYTHGTHITVAHAMGATIGINSMILLAAIGYIIGVDKQKLQAKSWITISYWSAQISLAVFWLALITAGVIKAYRMVALNMQNFQEMMMPVYLPLKIVAYMGVLLSASLLAIVVVYIRHIVGFGKTEQAVKVSYQQNKPVNY